MAARMNEADYHQLIRSLNIKQREFYHHVLTWIKAKDEPLYAFLTGGAGVGKSVVVKALFQGLHRYLCSKAYFLSFFVILIQ
jgi:predicted GTPase